MKKKNILTVAVCVLVLLASIAAVTAVVRFMPEIKATVAALTGTVDKAPSLATVEQSRLGVRKYSFDELEKAENVDFDVSLILVNREYKIPSDYSPELTDINNSGVLLDRRFANAYVELRKAVKDNCDDNLYIMSSYRTGEEQREIKKTEGKTAANEGESEHQTGLAADVYVMYHAGKAFADSKAGEFVSENGKDYGFIIRYPAYGEKSTGFSYEPWHIRFVGLPHSDIITSQKLTLEQYVTGLARDTFYTFGEYVITRQVGSDGLTLPGNFKHCTVSPDNTGSYICTVLVG